MVGVIFVVFNVCSHFRLFPILTCKAIAFLLGLCVSDIIRTFILSLCYILYTRGIGQTFGRNRKEMINVMKMFLNLKEKLNDCQGHFD